MKMTLCKVCSKVCRKKSSRFENVSCGYDLLPALVVNISFLVQNVALYISDK